MQTLGVIGGSGLYSMPGFEAEQDAVNALGLVGLADAAKSSANTLSHGMYKRVGIAQAFLGNPEVILLDEPTAGLDPGGTHAVLDIVRERRSRGDTVIFTTHQLEDVVQVCDRLYLLAEGRRRAAGTLHDLLATVGLQHPHSAICAFRVTRHERHAI